MAEPRLSGDTVRAAGAVLWRIARAAAAPSSLSVSAEVSAEVTASSMEIALIHRPKYDDWTFPKGKLKNGEHVLRAVVREVEEETGIRPLLGRRLPPCTYMKDGRPKRVDYWAATPAPADPLSAAAPETSAIPFVPNDEVDRLVWLPPDEVERLLTYERDIDLLHEFTAGPLRTRPVIIIRHGSAGDKRAWLEGDTLRPLDQRGRSEAGQLAGLLSPYGPVRLISSTTARCVETMLPYALDTGTSLATERAFTLGEASLERASERFGELVADGVPLIVCTHGELVGELITELCELFGEKVPEDLTLRKGSFWVAHLAVDPVGAVGGIAALERHSPIR